jgi:multidrug efflux pump subunit AcrA (membrane-fusion protein)
LRALREGGAGASLKMIDAAQADQARAQAQAQAAEARFASRWGPMATLPAAARQKLIEASARGSSVLLRAELPGRHTVGVLPARAVVDVDGIEVPGRVLGLLRESSEQQGVGLLIEVPNAPAGLGPGARIPVALLTADRQGLLLPRDALLYDERGAYVYKQLTKKSDADKALYAAVRVNLLLPLGDGWLVEGVDDDDNIVVHGAGVLWSLQGVGAQQHDDED